MSFSDLNIPSYLLNPPVSYNTNIPNNVWMEELSENDRKVNQDKAMRQWLELYSFIASEAFVQVLPTPADCGLQDLTFVANLGIVLENIEGKDVVVLSNFTSKPRIGETEVGRRFFQLFGCDVCTSPHLFEGEAEMKHLHDNVYCGGYGIRSEKDTYYWMEEEFGLDIIKLEETEPHLYHLDTTIFPITKKQTLVCTEMFTKRELKRLERYTEIIDVSVDDCFSGICNSVRLYNMILNASNIHELHCRQEEYKLEQHKNRRLEDIAAELGCEVVFFNLSEFLKGGALLSCLVMHLNRNSYKIDLL